MQGKRLEKLAAGKQIKLWTNYYHNATHPRETEFCSFSQSKEFI